jgi:lincosamide nucleotidyltransferase
MLQRLRDICQADQRLIAALLYGSFTTGEADAYSDIECVLFFAEDALATIDRQQWVNQITRTLLFFADDFGHYTALFENLVRGEFHFNSIKDVGVIPTWKGNAWFPSVEATLLLDRTGEVAKALQPLIGAAPERDTSETLHHIVPNFVNLVVFGMNVLSRGELARALEVLGLVHRSLLWMVRMVEQNTIHWPTPSKGLEKDLSAGSYAQFVRCTSALDEVGLRRAYRMSWVWGQELIHVLSERHRTVFPSSLLEVVTAQFFSEPVTPD